MFSSTGQNVAYKVLKLPNAAALSGGSWAPVNDKQWY